MLNLPELGNLISLLSAGIMYMIVQPLKEAIRALQGSIDRLTEKTEGNAIEIGHVREKVLVQENSIKTLFKTTKSLQDNIGLLERRCENCPKRKE